MQPLWVTEAAVTVSVQVRIVWDREGCAGEVGPRVRIPRGARGRLQGRHAGDCFSRSFLLSMERTHPLAISSEVYGAHAGASAQGQALLEPPLVQTLNFHKDDWTAMLDPS